jgi:ectoine hydroxylase-related dioxygenase (phytanoyl-CoA dioxygenase family)
MCGVWVALEDVIEGSGELSFYPGSHRTPKLFMDSFGLEKITNDDYSQFATTFDVVWKKISEIFPKKTAVLKKGDVLVWASNLIHGGSPRKIFEITRRSVVLHYFAMGSAVYYDATGDLGYSGELPI